MKSVLKRNIIVVILLLAVIKLIFTIDSVESKEYDSWFTFYNGMNQIMSNSDMSKQLKEGNFVITDNVKSADVVLTNTSGAEELGLYSSSRAYKEFGYSPIIAFMSTSQAEKCKNDLITISSNSENKDVYNINMTELLKIMLNTESPTWNDVLGNKDTTEVRLALPSKQSEAYEEVKKFIETLLPASNTKDEDLLRIYDKSYSIDITEDNVWRALDTDSVILIAPEYCIGFIGYSRNVGDINTAAYPIEPTIAVEFCCYYNVAGKEIQEGKKLSGAEIAERFVKQLNTQKFFGPVTASAGIYHNLCIRPYTTTIVGSSTFFDHSKGFVTLIKDEEDSTEVKSYT